MKPASVGRSPHGLSWFLVFIFSSLGYAQHASQIVATKYSPQPNVARCGSGSPSFLGAYLSDGKFRGVSTPSCNKQASLSKTDALADSSARPREVPGFVNLHPRERVVENQQPPARAMKTAKRRLFLAALRDQIVTVAYGREKTLLGPRHVTADSQGRMIISDPDAHAVHVLGGDNSFRIAAGPDRRLHQPDGVAVDAQDNIYIADADRGVVVVYDRNGIFLQDIGKLGDETLFHSPTSIAIDRKNGRLYLLDTPREVLFMLDLQGKVLKRVGRGRGRTIGRLASPASPLDLHNPTEIVVGKDRLAVLDSTGSRILVLDLECNLLQQFNIRNLTGRETADEIGLGMDSDDNVYVSNLGEFAIRIYDPAGHLTGSFGKAGPGAGEFNAPSGLWIDLTNKMYVADTNNSRVQMFQLTPSPPKLSAVNQ